VTRCFAERQELDGFVHAMTDRNRGAAVTTLGPDRGLQLAGEGRCYDAGTAPAFAVAHALFACFPLSDIDSIRSVFDRTVGHGRLCDARLTSRC
jgi:hypothetical protein